MKRLTVKRKIDKEIEKFIENGYEVALTVYEKFICITIKTMRNDDEECFEYENVYVDYNKESMMVAIDKLNEIYAKRKLPKRNSVLYIEKNKQ